MIRSILTEPHVRLRDVSEPVTDFGAGLAALAEDLIETMRANNGVGIAAPQVGISQRVIVVDWGLASGGESLPVVLVNPIVLRASGREALHEACLSVPGITREVERATSIEIGAQRTNSLVFSAAAHGLVARVVLHEIDHLDGRTILRRAA